MGGDISFDDDVVVATDRSSGEYAKSWAANDDQSVVGSINVGDIAVGVFKISSIRNDDNGWGWEFRYGKKDGVYTEQFIVPSYVLSYSRTFDIYIYIYYNENRQQQKKWSRDNIS